MDQLEIKEKVNNGELVSINLSKLDYGIHYYKFEDWRGIAYFVIYKQEGNKSINTININLGSAGNNEIYFTENVYRMDDVNSSCLFVYLPGGYKLVSEDSCIDEYVTMVNTYLESSKYKTV